MMRFVFLAALASTFMPSLPLGLKGFTLSHLTDAKSGNFNDICKWFCAENDYEDYSFFRSLDHVVNPRIFCELCKKKTTSTTSQTTTSAVTTTQNTSTSETTLKPTTMSERTTIMPTTGPTTPTTQPTAPTTQPTTPTTSTTTPEVV